MKEDQLLPRRLGLEEDQCLFETVELLQIPTLQTFVDVIFARSNVDAKSLKWSKFS